MLCESGVVLDIITVVPPPIPCAAFIIWKGDDDNVQPGMWTWMAISPSYEAYMDVLPYGFCCIRSSSF